MENDIEDRAVYEVHTVFKTILGEEVSYKTYYKLDSLTNGLASFMELELLNRTIRVGQVVYNTRQIVSLTSKIVGKRLVKKEVRENAGYNWTYIRRLSEHDLE